MSQYFLFCFVLFFVAVLFSFSFSFSSFCSTLPSVVLLSLFGLFLLSCLRFLLLLQLQRKSWTRGPERTKVSRNKGTKTKSPCKL